MCLSASRRTLVVRPFLISAIARPSKRGGSPGHTTGPTARVSGRALSRPARPHSVATLPAGGPPGDSGGTALHGRTH
jgi:hypothetical protein